MSNKVKMSPQQRANLRVCASCEWVYEGADKTCPKCEFVSYGARWVYGRKAYGYKRTQIPWKERKMSDYECKLNMEILESLPPKKTRLIDFSFRRMND